MQCNRLCEGEADFESPLLCTPMISSWCTCHHTPAYGTQAGTKAAILFELHASEH